MSDKVGMTKAQKRLVMAILLGVLSLAWLVPFFTTGVVNNDALMNHLHSVYKPLLYERDVQQGRVIHYFLSYPFSLILYVSGNFYIARIRDYCFLMLSMCSLGALYYKFFHRFTFSCLSICISLAMLPVTFEHTIPQAYCGFALYFSVFIGAVILFLKLPLLPMAVSARYQTQVNESDFISVPAVYFSYLAVSFIISYIIWEIIARFNKKAIFIVVVVVSVFSMGIQLMNHVIENRQKEGLF